MKLVYVAGPYRGKTTSEVELNIASAKQIAKLVANKGYMPVVPHLNTQGFEHISPDIPAKFWLEGTLEMLRRCDAMVLCPGWEYSHGTLNEIKEAKKLKIPILYDIFSLNKGVI